MRVFCVPNRDDVLALNKDFSGDPDAMAAESVADVEALVRHAVRPAIITGEMHLGRGKFLTEHFPINTLVVEGVRSEDLDVDSERGVIYASVLKGPYLFSYKVGYEDGTLPATLQKLIYEVMVRKMNLADKSREDIETLLAVWMSKRETVEKSRHAPSTN